MPKLKDFLKSQQGALVARNSGQLLAPSLAGALASISGSKSMFAGKEAEFADAVESLVGSEPFTDELSELIGTPRAGEAEDDFVVRAKSEMTKLLKKKLGG